MDFPNKAEGAKAAGPPPKKKIEPVVSGAEHVKRPASRRFFAYLFAESPKNISAQVGKNVIAPRFKAVLEEALNSFIASMFWGDGQNRPLTPNMRTTTLRGNITQYNQVTTLNPNAPQQVVSVATPHQSGNYEDLVVPTMEEAQRLFAHLLEHLTEYRVVSVGDLYEYANMPTAISHNAYGWYSLDGARIRPLHGRFLLELPRPVLL